MPDDRHEQLSAVGLRTIRVRRVLLLLASGKSRLVGSGARSGELRAVDGEVDFAMPRPSAFQLTQLGRNVIDDLLQQGFAMPSKRLQQALPGRDEVAPQRFAHGRRRRVHAVVERSLQPTPTSDRRRR